VTTKDEWIALAERCEKATGSDRDIERCMGSLLPEGFQMIPYFGFTGSLDAITTLIERELPVCGVRLHIIPTFAPTRAVAQILVPCDNRTDGDAATPALALCAAFCRAMAAGA
jgi:hypothetical protein